MTTQLLTPKYVTKEIVKKAIDTTLRAVMSEGSLLREELTRTECHMVIVVPGMIDVSNIEPSKWPKHRIVPFIFYEESVGDPATWIKCPFDTVARRKALQLWTKRNGTMASGVIPHLLFPGDTIYWGGVKRQGIISTCSGVQPHFDRLISGMNVDTIIALAHHEYLKDRQANPQAHFLSF